jgi:hypothetical protein
MENPFNLSDDKLKELLNAYFDWIKRNDNEAEYIENERKKAEIRRKTLLNKDYISKLSDEKLADEILKYVKALEGPVGIRLGKPRISGEISKIRRNILYFIDSEEDPFKKAERIIEGDYKISIFHKAFWSPLFQAKYPELLPNWNNKTDKFMKKIGVNLTTSKKSTEEKYRLYSEAFHYLNELYPGCDFFDLDHLTHYGVAIDEGVKLINELTNPAFEGFTDKTFQLLETLSKDTSYEAVYLIKDEIHKEVIEPIKQIFKELSLEFDTKNVLNLEKDKQIMGRLFKPNPKLGAYHHIWGTFYQKGQTKDASMQFFIWICKDYLSCGVYYSRNNAEIKNRLIHNLEKYKDELNKYISKNFFEEMTISDEHYDPNQEERITYEANNINELIKLFKEKGINVGKIYQKEIAIQEGKNIKDKIKDLFEKLVPLYIMGISDNPLEILKDYYEGNTQYWRIVLPLDTKDYVVWPNCKEKGLIAVGYLDNPKAPDVGKMRDKMKIGDKVIAYLEKGRVGGVGTITGEFEDYSDAKPADKDLFNGDFWRRRKVHWDYLPKDGEFWTMENNMPGARTTVFELSKEQFEEILSETRGKVNPYTKERILEEIFISDTEFNQIVKLLKDSKKKQIILQGPPGTGKTFIAQRIARYITQNDNLVETIQFHPSYSYEDFIEGYRPKNNGFELSDGIFKQFCTKARSDQDNNYVLIIDEINRGNLSKIFGELLYLLEYRNQKVRLTYSQKEFFLPENLYIIGTMNTADRSLAIMDYALRRRFYFKNINCQTKRLKDWLNENSCKINLDDLLDAIKNMNDAIEKAMHCSDYNIGHSYFMRERLNEESLNEIINFGVEPLLHEYFFDKNEKIVQIIAPLKNLLKVENQQNDE